MKSKNNTKMEKEFTCSFKDSLYELNYFQNQFVCR